MTPTAATTFLHPAACIMQMTWQVQSHVGSAALLSLEHAQCPATTVSNHPTVLHLLAVGMAVLGTFSCELFATPIRASAMGIFNEAGRLGSIIAPLMLMVGSQVKPDNAVFVPFLAFGVAALLAGILALVLPETLGASMPEDIEVEHCFCLIHRNGQNQADITCMVVICCNRLFHSRLAG